jgi:HPt (histidine-containing phosphotransfer) domain-containing protein
MQPSHQNVERKLDPAALDKIRAMGRPGGPSMLVKLSRLYFASVAKEIHQMSDSLTKKDAATLRRSAHTLKSSSAQIGATQLARLCQELEHVAAAGDLEAAAARLPGLQAECDSVCAELKALVAVEAVAAV